MISDLITQKMMRVMVQDLVDQTVEVVMIAQKEVLKKKKLRKKHLGIEIEVGK